MLAKSILPLCFLFFFFQAEDGIRDRSPSRGLGDVYKRQDCCGVQFYAGNFIGEQTGKGGAAYHDRSAFCLESQFYPNAVNEPDFPSPVVKAGDTYHTETSYRFYLR